LSALLSPDAEAHFRAFSWGATLEREPATWRYFPEDEPRFVPANASGEENRHRRTDLERALTERDGYTCFYCERPGLGACMHVDHVVPAECGGTDAFGNLVWACDRCNLGKSRMPGWFFVFWRTRGMA
jgi:hypothetical protein